MHYPRHVGIIPDGNRTRAKEQGHDPLYGHRAGMKSSEKLIQHIFTTTPIEVVTLWGLSSENRHKRGEKELNHLFKSIFVFPQNILDFCIEHRIRIQRMGNRATLPLDVVEALDEQIAKVSFPDAIKQINICINYGGQDEIIRGIQRFMKECDSSDTLTAEKFSSYLDFAAFPPLELVIRTKGDMSHRLSGFMSRWIGYAELYFSKKKFPAFTPADFEDAMTWFDSIVAYRNFGK